MAVAAVAHRRRLSPDTARLLARMTGRFTGVAQQIGAVARGRAEPRLCVIGGDMTGVHELTRRQAPPPGSYHIGGCGLSFEDAMIRTLGETVERYASFVAAAFPRLPTTHCSYRELHGRGDPVLVPDRLRWFTDEQLARRGFPCAPFNPDAPTGWVQAPSLLDGGARWMPAQEAFPGYVGRPQERRFVPGVSTGSAAHTRLDLALRNALLELVQIDAAMGHWYSGGTAVAIGSDSRTGSLDRVVAGRLPVGARRPRFFWMPSADLPGFAVACLVESRSRPHVGAGLGCDLRLDRAMAKAFLEGAAVAELAKVILFRHRMRDETPRGSDLYDLDENVGFYADEPRDLLAERFPDLTPVPPTRLPPDRAGEPLDDVAHLVDCFESTGKELVVLDLTSHDVANLGFVALRAWSPDVLTLSLPSAPPLEHRRFDAYGGAVDAGPHPYP